MRWLLLLNNQSIVINSKSMRTSGDWESMKDTIAHEIGHVIIGTHQPAIASAIDHRILSRPSPVFAELVKTSGVTVRCGAMLS